MRRDARGCAVTGAGPAALEHYERALAALVAWRGDAAASARAACEAAPGFTIGHLLEAHVHLCSRDSSGYATARAALARASALPMNARERLHAGALAAALAGDSDRAAALLGGLLAQNPRDLLALVVAHTLDYYLGETAALHARVASALPAWSRADAGYHGVLAMLAFGLEEAGRYERAEEAAHAALELEPGNIRAHHAMSHVYEMQGRAAIGVRWMAARSAHWTGAGAASTHVWWHLALYHLMLGDARHALALYDRRIASREPALNELIDASGLLWRLQLAGVDCRARWEVLAAAWAPRAEDANCAFNDLHAMLAFVGAGRRDLQRRLLRAQTQRLSWGGTNRGMLREVGLPACRGLAALGAGDYVRAERLLRDLPAVSHRLGGSHAQRGLIGLTYRAARKWGTDLNFPQGGKLRSVPI
ncbi:MAG: tetratricopeptide repeat protein [Burkholderiales bacterium]